jgi:hypothetical protein
MDAGRGDFAGELRCAVVAVVSELLAVAQLKSKFPPPERTKPLILGQYGRWCLQRSRGDQSAFNQRAAASAVSSGRVLNAIDALGAALWTALMTVSNSCRFFGGSRRPPPITTQS